MKCFSRQQCEDLFHRSGVTIADDGDLNFAKVGYRVAVDLPSAPLQIARFAARLAQWLPDGHYRALWPSVWSAYPAQAVVLFEKIRNGCGETRPLGQAPCHLFEKFVGDSDDFYKEEESAILSGLVFLMLTFDWSGYVLSVDHQAHVLLRDNGIVFCTSDNGKLVEASAMAREFAWPAPILVPARSMVRESSPSYRSFFFSSLAGRRLAASGNSEKVRFT